MYNLIRATPNRGAHFLRKKIYGGLYMAINYVFHIGGRCQSLAYMKENALLSGYNCFSGAYVSFPAAVNIITNNFKDVTNYIVKFKIADIGTNKKDNIVFARCHDYTGETKDRIAEYINCSKWDFFYQKNFYFNSDYCINMAYTDIDNLSNNDLILYKNNYFVLPNSDYTNNVVDIERLTRRTQRFNDCLSQKDSSSILLVFMDTLTLDTEIDIKMKNVVEIYQLPYNLCYVIPTYSNDDVSITEKIIRVNNITFSIIQFPSLSVQKRDHPGDDNWIGYRSEFDKIKETLTQSYDINLICLFP